MIILDTNVVSEIMRPTCDPRVSKWLDQQAAETLFLTATTLAELLVGLETMPNGQRKQALFQALDTFRTRLMNPKLLPFDQDAATLYAALVARARSKGRPILIADGQIAAIAKLHGFAVATRDTSPFEAAGVPFINPWLS